MHKPPAALNNVHVSPSNSLMTNIGRRHREAVHAVFTMNGGVEWLRQWSEENPSDFFTKIWAKTITREVEVQHTTSIEDKLLELDGHPIDNSINVEDAQFVEVTDERW